MRYIRDDAPKLIALTNHCDLVGNGIISPHAGVIVFLLRYEGVRETTAPLSLV